MALVILDGNQSATTLSTIVVSSAHIPAHTVVSLGTQAKTDILSAVSSGIAISGTVTANAFGEDKVNIGDFHPIPLTDGGEAVSVSIKEAFGSAINVPISGTVTIGSALPAGTNRIGVVTIGAGTVTIGAGTAQIGSVTASISNSLTISSLPAISGTVTANAGNNFAETIGNGLLEFTLNEGVMPISGTVTANVAGNLNNTIEFYDEASAEYVVGVHIKDAGNNVLGGGTPLAISGTVTANLGKVSFEFGQSTTTANGVLIGWESDALGVFRTTSEVMPFPTQVLNSVTIGSLPAISGTVTANLGLMQSVVATEGLTASGTFVKIGGHTGTSTTGNIAHVSAVGAIRVDGSNYNQPISGTVTANTFAVQGTAVTTSNFTSTNPSTVLASFNATREVLTIFNEGAGNLHICAGATCTTIAYQVRLSTGDYYEVPNHQTTITHSAVFATAGTARVTQIS
jgi:hypothetical protein